MEITWGDRYPWASRREIASASEMVSEAAQEVLPESRTITAAARTAVAKNFLILTSRGLPELPEAAFFLKNF
jgi:hypothetical protein